MKKIAMVMVAAPLFLSAAQAADNGTINFSGVLSSSTCNVTVGQGDNSTVSLPSLSASMLSSSGQVAGQTPFNISVSGCSAADSESSSVKAYFEHNGNTDANGRLNNTGDAQNVKLQLLDGSQSWQAINVGDVGQQDGGYVAISSGSATLPYAVRYYATGAATAGTVTSSATFNLVYN